MENDEKYPLSIVQRDIFFHQQSMPDCPCYNIGGYIKFIGSFNKDRFDLAFKMLIESTDALRLQFTINNFEPVQHISKVTDNFCQFIEFNSTTDAKIYFENFIDSQIKTPFSVLDKPLFRSYLIKISENEFWWVLVVHHLIMDGWSYSLAKTKMSYLYNYFGAGINVGNQRPPQFLEALKNSDEYVGSKSYLESKLFWLNQYSIIPERIIYEKSRSHGNGKKIGFSGLFLRKIDACELNKIKSFAASLNIAIPHIFIALCYLYFSRIGNRRSVPIGISTHNRRGEKLKKTIGMFSSITPMLFEFSDDITFDELAVGVSKAQRKFMRHQRYPASHLYRELKLLGQNRPELYDVCVNYLPFNYEVEFEGLTTESHHLNNGNVQTPIEVMVKDFGENLDGLFELTYNFNYLDNEEAELLVNRFFYVMKQVMRDPSVRISEVVLTPKSELQKLLIDFNATEVDCSSDKSIVWQFEEQVLRHSNKNAVIFGSQSITYDQLNKESEKLAICLIRLGVKPDSLVGLCMDRSIDMIIAILGIIRAGGGYLPLDPQAPQQRINTILNDSKPVCILVNNIYRTKIPITEKIIAVEDSKNLQVDTTDVDKRLLSLLFLKQSLASIAYAIYTSGSTGIPKAVLVEHVSLINQLEWMKSEYSTTSADIILHKTPLTFDVSVWEIFLPLVCGATMVVAKPDGHRDSRYLCELIRKHHITMLEFVPSILRVIVNDPAWSSCVSLRVVMSGGEALPPDIVNTHYEINSARLDNTYGPTEATITVSNWVCQKNELFTRVPIGKPIRNAQFYVLDKNKNILPVGVVGELYIGGAGLSRGYLNRDELNAKCFFDLVLPDNIIKRVYRSGDLVRWLPNGNIEYISRADDQVKIRGQRLELGEIESIVLTSKFVRSAVVTMQENLNKDSYLVAYVIRNENFNNVNNVNVINSVRVELLNQLPEFMVPSAIIVLDEIPLSVNGKVDKKSLPLVDFKQNVSKYTPPSTAQEEKIAAIWEKLLEVNPIGLNDNFFSLGGNSLNALHMITQLSNYIEVEIPIGFIFEEPQLKGFSDRINKHKDSIVFVDGKSKVKNSTLAYLFLPPNQRSSFATSDSNRNKFLTYFLINETINRPEYLNAAMQSLVENNDALRLRSVIKDEKWSQHIDEKIIYGFSYHDLSDRDEYSQKLFMKVESAKVCENIDIKLGPLVSMSVFQRTKEKDCYILFVAHHIVCDAISAQVIGNEILSYYNKLLAGDSILTKNVNTYSDYCDMWRQYQESQSFFDRLELIQSGEYKKNAYPIVSDFDIPFYGRHGRGKYFRVSNIDISFFSLSARQQECLIVSTLTDFFGDEYQLEYVSFWLTRNARSAALQGYDFSRTIGWFADQLPIWVKSNSTLSALDKVNKIQQQINSEEGNISAYSLAMTNDSENIKNKIQDIKWPEIVINYLGVVPFEEKNSFFYDRSDILNSLSNASENVVNKYKFFIMVDASKINREISIDWQFSGAQFYDGTIKHFIDRFKYLFNIKLNQIVSCIQIKSEILID